ncbi:basic proline-rich protein-like [Oenanthe melanoleuca]|uniref:basic proline-rich protein-like n=1 Tax=Oenanthe melanoleuca TaxID=2939378 RepID=UPI0024C13BA6|nr:basic proline-rich protein-like [Oenanthe melanoleuca]
MRSNSCSPRHISNVNGSLIAKEDYGLLCPFAGSEPSAPAGCQPLGTPGAGCAQGPARSLRERSCPPHRGPARPGPARSLRERSRPPHLGPARPGPQPAGALLPAPPWPGPARPGPARSLRERSRPPHRGPARPAAPGRERPAAASPARGGTAATSARSRPAAPRPPPAPSRIPDPAALPPAPGKALRSRPAPRPARSAAAPAAPQRRWEGSAPPPPRPGPAVHPAPLRSVPRSSGRGARQPGFVPRGGSAAAGPPRDDPGAAQGKREPCSPRLRGALGAVQCPCSCAGLPQLRERPRDGLPLVWASQRT